MIAFFLTMPISRITPSSAIRLNSELVAISANAAPTPAEGRVLYAEADAIAAVDPRS
jgi:hypothetical protein